MTPRKGPATDLPHNPFKAALAAHRRQVGLWCTIPDPSVAELCATCGFDWLMFDTEHSPMDAPAVLPLLQAVAPYPAAPVVRPGWNDAVEIKKLLDLGAQTILVPFVQTAREAEAAVAATRYPPHGMRGISGTRRATRWGGIEGCAQMAADEICVIVQVETADAMARVEEIVAVPGVDGVFIGPGIWRPRWVMRGRPARRRSRRWCWTGSRGSGRRARRRGC